MTLCYKFSLQTFFVLKHCMLISLCEVVENILGVVSHLLSIRTPSTKYSEQVRKDSIRVKVSSVKNANEISTYKLPIS